MKLKPNASFGFNYYSKINQCGLDFDKRFRINTPHIINAMPIIPIDPIFDHRKTKQRS